MTAVIFDLFGTLLQIRNRQNPFRQLLRLGSQQGRAASPGDLRWIMTNAGGLQEAADFLESNFPPLNLLSSRAT